MTAGIPGAGIGGLFYLGATILLPVRSLWRRVRRRQDSVTRMQLVHSLLLAAGIIAALWLSGWLLTLVIPHEVLSRETGAHPPAPVRTALPLATFGIAVTTLVVVLLAVEVAWHFRQVAAASEPDDL